MSNITPELLKAIAKSPELLRYHAKVLFKGFDSDQSGRLERSELRKLLMAMHGNLQLPAPDELMLSTALMRFDFDHTDGFSEQQFVKWFSAFVAEQASAATSAERVDMQPESQVGSMASLASLISYAPGVIGSAVKEADQKTQPYAPNVCLGSNCCLSVCSPCLSCWSFICPWLYGRRVSDEDQVAVSFGEARKRNNSQQAEFERTVKFLRGIPLFAKQMPPSELPKIAELLEKKEWEPGELLVKQGDPGRALFLIMSGELKGVTRDASGKEERGISDILLQAGDYFGGHTLQSNMFNVCDVVASKKTVTLSMSRSAFEEVGLHKSLTFPKRPALHHKRSIVITDTPVCSLKSQAELVFVKEAILANVNLKRVLAGREKKEEDKPGMKKEGIAELVEQVASTAYRREVLKGEIVASVDEVGEDFFVIESGAFDVLVNTPAEQSGPRAAESVVARSAMAKRLHRRQAFLRDLACSSCPLTVRTPRDKRANKSMIYDVGPRLPAERSDEDPRVTRRATLGIGQKQKALNSPTLTARNRGMSEEDRAELDKVDLKPGDLVTCALPGEFKEVVGKVTGFEGVRVVVTFGEERKEFFPHFLKFLRKVKDPDVLTTLKRKDSFGELSLIYNYRREATFKATEDSVIFVINQAAFRGLFERRGGNTHSQRVALLREVDLLSHLVQAEVDELATHALSNVSFKPNENVLVQGEKRQAKLWYVVAEGSAIMSKRKGGDKNILAELCRGKEFGERSLLRGTEASDVAISAGPNGMVCLTFNGEVLAKMLENSPLPEEAQKRLQTEPIEAWADRKNAQQNKFSNLKLGDLEEVCVLGSGSFGTVTLVQVKRRMPKGTAWTISVPDPVKQICGPTQLDAEEEKCMRQLEAILGEWQYKVYEEDDTETIGKYVITRSGEDLIYEESGLSGELSPDEADHNRFVAALTDANRDFIGTIRLRYQEGKMISNFRESEAQDWSQDLMATREWEIGQIRTYWSANRQKNVQCRVIGFAPDGLVNVEVFAKVSEQSGQLIRGEERALPKDKLFRQRTPEAKAAVEDMPTQFALKKMSKGHIVKMGTTKHVVWEKDLLICSKSRFVIGLVKTFKDDQFIYFLLEPALGGNLWEALKHESRPFSADNDPDGRSVAFYIACVTGGLEHLHDRNIAYRDLKPENVMLDSRGYGKLCDMGFARFVLGKTYTRVGTPEYMAPEVIDAPHAHDMNVDWWALGVLCFELVNDQCPWEDDGVADQDRRLEAIRRSQERAQPRYPRNGYPSQRVKTFIKNLLQPEEGRLGAKKRNADGTESGGAACVRMDPWLRSSVNFDALHSGELPSPYVPPPFEAPADGDELLADSGSIFERYEADESRWSGSSMRWTDNF